MEKILSALRQLGIERYNIEETATESVECFFVRKKLDLKRRTGVTAQKVTVYRPFEKDGKKMLGSSSVRLSPDETPEEIRQSLKKAYFAASLVCHPAYELFSGKKEAPVPAKGGFAGQSLEQSMEQMAEALFAGDTAEDAFLNSAELFLYRRAKHIVNSSGVDVGYESFECWGEYVVQCLEPRDVETYHHFSYKEPETEALRREVRDALDMTRARAKAESAPQTGEYALLLDRENLQELLSYYLSRADTGMVYQKYSSFALGDKVQGEEIRGDALTIQLKAEEPYSAEGIPMADRPLLEEGVLKTLHGGARFADYLGIEATGGYRSIRLPAGKTPLNQLKSGKYLHVLSFSDFQMDAMSGHFGGEIRLALLCDGETVTPVTGGSVNGSILQAQKEMRFSAETCRCPNYEGPLAVRIENVSVAGI